MGFCQRVEWVYRNDRMFPQKQITQKVIPHDCDDNGNGLWRSIEIYRRFFSLAIRCVWRNSTGVFGGDATRKTQIHGQSSSVFVVVFSASWVVARAMESAWKTPVANFILFKCSLGCLCELARVCIQIVINTNFHFEEIDATIGFC